MDATDISDWQQGFSVADYAAAGGQLLILKASEGASWRSSTMAAWRDEAHSLGLFVWLYHFLRADPTDAEVSNFLEAIGGGLRDGEAAVCDFESQGLALSGLTAAQTGMGTPMGHFVRNSRQLAAAPAAAPAAVGPGRSQGLATLGSDAAQNWCGSVQTATSRPPILYSYFPFLDARDTTGLTRWPLWIAGYGPDDGVEHPWPSTDRWAPFQDGPGAAPHAGRTIGWQYTSKGHVAGYGGPLDVSRFDLTRDDLALLAGSAPADSLGDHGRLRVALR